MSGAEVIGLVSGILTIIDTISKLYSAIENTHNLPQAFREVGRRLPLIQDTLKIAEERMNRNDHGTTYAAIRPAVKSCKETAERLKQILQELAPGPDSSRVQRYRLAVRMLGKDSQVEKLMKSILEDVYLLAGNQAIRAATEAQVGEVLKAIQYMSNVPPSALYAVRSHTFAHYGTGYQINNTCQGTQNVNTGHGNQFTAHSMTFEGRPTS